MVKSLGLSHFFPPQSAYQFQDAIPWLFILYFWVVGATHNAIISLPIILVTQVTFFRHFLLYSIHMQNKFQILILCWVRSKYNATTVKKLMSEIYIMALRVGPKPQKRKVSKRGIGHMHLAERRQQECATRPYICKKQACDFSWETSCPISVLPWTIDSLSDSRDTSCPIRSGRRFLRFFFLISGFATNLPLPQIVFTEED